MKFQMSYREMEAALLGKQNIGSKRLPAVRSRLRKLQHHGLTPSVRTGKGTKAAYGAEEVFLMALGVELSHFGLSPGEVVRILSGSRGVIRGAAGLAIERVQSDPAEAIYIVFEPQFLSVGDQFLEVFDYSHLRYLLDARQFSYADINRLCVINITTTVRRIAHQRGGKIDWFETDFARDLTDWAARGEGASDVDPQA